MEMYRVGKFAKLVGVHPQTVKRWIYSKKINAVKIGKEAILDKAVLKDLIFFGEGGEIDKL
jgi:excisionase family DNA binding protein